MRLVFDLKKDADPIVVENLLYKHSQLQSTYAIRNIALMDGGPKTLTLKDLLRAYRDHRFEVIRRRTAFLLDKAERRLHILEGLMVAIQAIDEVIAMPGGLPLLSFTLAELYRMYLERGADDRALIGADYEALGGVVGALRSRATALHHMSMMS